MGFCWDCGRFNVHHERCKNNPLNMGPNPMFQPGQPYTDKKAKTPEELAADVDPNDPNAPPLSQQRYTRSCLTFWVCFLCSVGVVCFALSMFFLSAAQQQFNTTDEQSALQYALGCGIISAATAIPGIILSISWCCAFCCCKKRWVCQCCR